MKPSQLSAYLRRMASQIDLARSPRKDLVVRDLRRALAALTGGRRWANVPGGGGDAMTVMSTWFEGGSYDPEDIVGGLPAPDAGPIWAALYSFGWIIAFDDPATIPPEAPVDGSGIVDTWGEMQEHEEFKQGVENLRKYPNAAAFVGQDDVIRFMCSYNDAERDGIARALDENGYSEAAAKVHSVEF